MPMYFLFGLYLRVALSALTSTPTASSSTKWPYHWHHPTTQDISDLPKVPTNSCNQLKMWIHCRNLIQRWYLSIIFASRHNFVAVVHHLRATLVCKQILNLSCWRPNIAPEVRCITTVHFTPLSVAKSYFLYLFAHQSCPKHAHK